jgi:hypothetical protein
LGGLGYDQIKESGPLKVDHCSAQAYFGKKVYFGCMPIFGRKICYGNRRIFGEKDLFLDRVQWVEGKQMQEEKKHGVQEYKPDRDRVRVFEKHCNDYKPIK